MLKKNKDMKTRVSWSLAILAGLVGLGLVAFEEAGAQVAKGKSRPAATKFLMRGITQPH